MAVLYAGSVVAWAVGGARVRSAGCAAGRGRAARVPGVRADVPRGVERADLRGRVLALGVARRARGAGRRRLAGSPSRVLGVALLALIRPGNAVLLAFAVFPLVLAGRRRERLTARRRISRWPRSPARRLGGPERRALRRLRARARRQRGDSFLPRLHHGQDRRARQRAGVTPSRGGGAATLVTRDPYKSYGVTGRRGLPQRQLPHPRGLLSPVGPVFGWDTNYSVLRKAGIEAVQQASRRVRVRRARHDLAAAERVVLPHAAGEARAARAPRRSTAR